jgi:hypothetical protein
LPNTTPSLADLEVAAIEQLAIYYAAYIRRELDDNPDHSGPEDTAEALAEDIIAIGVRRLVIDDWRELLDRLRPRRQP